jgi:hypothetical protein
MGKLRRASLIAAAVSLAFCSMRGSPPAAGEDVTVDNGAAPGEFSVTNHGSAAVVLAGQVVVEMMESGKWVASPALVYLIPDCSTKVEVESVRLEAGKTLTVARWNGESCSGQCPRACRANAYLGPGEFRFVVRTADGKQRFAGAAFRLGARR